MQRITFFFFSFFLMALEEQRKTENRQELFWKDLPHPSIYLYWWSTIPASCSSSEMDHSSDTELDFGGPTHNSGQQSEWQWQTRHSCGLPPTPHSFEDRIATNLKEFLLIYGPILGTSFYFTYRNLSSFCLVFFVKKK